MRTIKIKAGVVALALGAALSVSAVASASASTLAVRPATSTEGCPSQDACLYPENAGWNGGNPSVDYYHYGVYDLNDVVGDHYFFNNQTGGALAYLCTQDGGNGTCTTVAEGVHGNYYFTPIYSILLEPQPGCIAHQNAHIMRPCTAT